MHGCGAVIGTACVRAEPILQRATYTTTTFSGTQQPSPTGFSYVRCNVKLFVHTTQHLQPQKNQFRAKHTAKPKLNQSYPFEELRRSRASTRLILVLQSNEAPLIARHLIRVSKAASGSVVQQSKARWNVTLHAPVEIADAPAASITSATAAAACTNRSVVSWSMLPSSSNACRRVHQTNEM